MQTTKFAIKYDNILVSLKTNSKTEFSKQTMERKDRKKMGVCGGVSSRNSYVLYSTVYSLLINSQTPVSAFNSLKLPLPFLSTVPSSGRWWNYILLLGVPCHTLTCLEGCECCVLVDDRQNFTYKEGCTGKFYVIRIQTKWRNWFFFSF